MDHTSYRPRQSSIGDLKPEIPKRSMDNFPESEASAPRDGRKHDPSLTRETIMLAGSKRAAILQRKEQKQEPQQPQPQQSPQLKRGTIFFDPNKYLPRVDPRTTIVFDPENYHQHLNPETTIFFDPQNIEGQGKKKSSSLGKEINVIDELFVLPDLDANAPPAPRVKPPSHYGRRGRRSRGVPSQIFGDLNPFASVRISECTFPAIGDDYSRDLFLEDRTLPSTDELKPSLEPKPMIRRISLRPNRQSMKKWKTNLRTLLRL